MLVSTFICRSVILMVAIIQVTAVFEIFVSNSTERNGTDSLNCGSLDQPCNSLQRALNAVPSSGGIIYLYGGDREGTNYLIYDDIVIVRLEKLFLYKWNISRFNPTITSPRNEAVAFHFHNFNRNLLLCINSVNFNSIGVATINTNRRLDINITNCSVSNADKVFNMPSRNYHTDTTINIKFSSFVNCQSAIDIGTRFDLYVFDSNFIGPKDNNQQYVGINMDCYFDCNAIVENTTFDGISTSLQVTSDTTLTLNVSNCRFQNVIQFNNTNNLISNIHVNGRFVNVNIETSQFINNTGWVGAAVQIIDARMVYIANTKFIQNKAADGGGACFFQKSLFPVVLDECTFHSNKVESVTLKRYYHQRAGKTHHDGGAILNFGNMNIYNSYFSDNHVSTFGGAISHGHTSDQSSQSLYIFNTTVIGAVASSLSGDLIYSRGSLTLENVTLIANSTTVDDVIFYQTLEGTVTLKKDFYIQCPPNNHIRKKSTLSKKNKTHAVYKMLMYYCVPCKKSTYNLSGAYEYIKNNTNQKSLIDIQCSGCPTGGKCDPSTGVTSADNFWGERLANGHLKFHVCFESKCCSSHGNPCTSYDSCDYNRKGTMCGQCIDGYAERFLVGGCIPCNKGWMASTWLALLLLVIGINGSFFFSEYIVCLGKQFLLYLKRKIWNKTIEEDNNTDYGNVFLQLVFFYNIIFSLHISSPNRRINLGPTVIQVIGDFFLGTSLNGPDKIFRPCLHEKATSLSNIYIPLIVVAVTMVALLVASWLLYLKNRHMKQGTWAFRMFYTLVKFYFLVYITVSKYLFHLLHTSEVGDDKLHVDANIDRSVVQLGFCTIFTISNCLLPLCLPVISHLLKTKKIGIKCALSSIPFLFPFGLLALLIDFIMPNKNPPVKENIEMDELGVDNASGRRNNDDNNEIDYILYNLFGNLRGVVKSQNQKTQTQSQIENPSVQQNPDQSQIENSSVQQNPDQSQNKSANIPLNSDQSQIEMSSVQQNPDQSQNGSANIPQNPDQSQFENQDLNSNRNSTTLIQRVREFGLAWTLARNLLFAAIQAFTHNPIFKLYLVIILFSIYVLIFYFFKLSADKTNKRIGLILSIFLIFYAATCIFWAFDFMSDWTYSNPFYVIGQIFLIGELILWGPVFFFTILLPVILGEFFLGWYIMDCILKSRL